MIIQLVFVYLLGGFTWLPLVFLLYLIFSKKVQQPNLEEKEKDRVADYAIQQGWIQLTDHYAPKLHDAKAMTFAVVKHGTLFCYDSEKMKKVTKILPIQDYTVSLYPNDKSEHQHYIRSSVIQLEHHERTLYLNCHRKTDKEDWYFGLLEAHRMLKDSPNEAQYVMMDSTHFDARALEDLIFQVQSTPGQREMGWLNAIIGRMFLGIYKTESFKEYLKTKIVKKINKKRPSFLEEVTVRQVDPGQSAPLITDPKLITLSPDGQVVVDAALDYRGGLTVHIQTVLHWSYSSRLKPIRVNLVLAVQLKRMTGRFMLKIKPPPTNRSWFAFYEMPEMEWRITPVVADKQITLSIVTNAIESRIREVMAETFVLPHMEDTPFCFSGGRGGIFEQESVEKETVIPLQSEEIIKSTIQSEDQAESVIQSEEQIKNEPQSESPANSILRKRSKKIDDDASSIKSSGSSFLRKLTNYLPSDSPNKRGSFIYKAEEYLNKKTTRSVKEETTLRSSTQNRSRANSYVGNKVTETKPPLPLRRNSTPVPFYQDEETETSQGFAPALPNKPRPNVKPPLPPRIKS